MLAASLVLARRFFPEGQEKPSPWAAWLVAGFWIGVGGLSKYQIVLFAIGLLIYLLSTPARRKELLHPAPWLGAAVALLVVMPVIIWNIQNDWVSIRFQASRGAAITGLHIGNFFGNIGGQILWMLPWIFVPLAIASWQALRGGRASERSWFCLCLALPIVATFTIIPIWGDRGLPHWQMPGWLMLFPVLGHYLSRLADAARVRRWAIASGILIVALVALLAAQSVTGYVRVLFPRAFTKDPTLESFEWNQLPPELAARGLLSRPGVFIITNNWTFAGKIDLALKGTLPIVIFRGEHKHYDFRFDPRSFVGRDAIVIGRVDSVVGIDNDLKPYFESIEDLPSFALGRAHMHEIELRMLLAHTLKRPLPAQFRRW
jgi:4-amino-4-deoxy-L-arabinose transferase-like glycosyltransferase